MCPVPSLSQALGLAVLFEFPLLSLHLCLAAPSSSFPSNLELSCSPAHSLIPVFLSPSLWMGSFLADCFSCLKIQAPSSQKAAPYRWGFWRPHHEAGPHFSLTTSQKRMQSLAQGQNWEWQDSDPGWPCYLCRASTGWGPTRAPSGGVGDLIPERTES